MLEKRGQVPSIKSAERVLDLLELLSDHQATGLEMEKIIEELKIPRSSFYALIRMLIQRGYVVKPAEGVFKLGVKTFEIGSSYQSNIEITEVAQPIMRELKNLTKETVNLTLFDRHRMEIVVLAREIGLNPLRFVSSLGTTFSAIETSSGRLFLSQFNEEEIRGFYYKKLDEQQLNSLQRKLDHIRSTGVAENNQETYPGVLIIAAPIRDKAQKIFAALNIGLPAHQLDQFKKECYIQLIKAASSYISHLLGSSVQPEIKDVTELRNIWSSYDINDL